MNLDLQDFSVHNAESRDLRAFQLGKTNDQMGGLGIVCPLDVQTGQVRWTMRMGMVDRDELFPGIGQISQNLDQFCRIHFELGRALGDIWHRYESPSLSRWRAGRGSRASNQTTRLFRICRLRMLNDLLQYSRCEPKVHGRSEEHTSELQSQSNLVCRLLLEKKKTQYTTQTLNIET